MTVSREIILGFDTVEIDRVFVKEFGGDVCVATLSADEADQISSLGEEFPATVGLVILGACDEDGKRLFTKKDAAALSKKPAKAIGAIAKKVLSHNGLGSEAAAEAKNDSSETENSASDSGSPSS